MEALSKSHDEESRTGALLNIKWLLAYLRPRLKGLLMGLALTALSALAFLGGPVLIKRAVDNDIARGDFRSLAMTAFLYLLVQSVFLLAGNRQRVLLETVGQECLAAVKVDLFMRIIRLPMRFHDENGPGSLITRIESDTEELRRLFSFTAVTLLSEAVRSIGSIAVMLAADARLTLLVCSLFPFIVLNAHLYNRRAAPLFLKARKAASDITGFLAERLEGLSIIRAFAAEEYCRTEMEDLNRKKYDLELRALRLDIFFFNALGLAETLSICALLWFGGRWVAEGALTAGALVGSTAAGKTTITSLLLRFYEPDGGAVFLDGTDIRLIPEEKLRSRIAPVLQDINVFPGSVAENLNPGGMLESATLKEKLARLPLDEVLPDTAKEESGRDLSVGQKQLISFARALLRNPDVLVLDEATSYIDPSSEEKARSAMHLLMEGRTCLIIAHRLSTVKDADCILVIQEGRITEQGTHRELLEKGGHYSALHSL